MTTALYDQLHRAMEKTRLMGEVSANHVLGAAFDPGAFPKAVVDFGCGRGDWLRAARTLGATRLLGIDPLGDNVGDVGVPKVSHDLTLPFSTPGFDLAVCVEVAEHLPASAAGTLVASIAGAAPRCLFSAAIPGQGGLFHINEQPPAYWAERFAAVGFDCYDPRPRLWNNDDVEPWYRQNLLFFAAPGQAPASWLPWRTTAPLHLVHPVLFAGHRRDPAAHVIWEFEDGRWQTTPVQPD